jgi:hypothetical protein
MNHVDKKIHTPFGGVGEEIPVVQYITYQFNNWPIPAPHL